jgi:hypothetical protein
MKTIIKALFLFVALTSALPVFAVSNFEATKARAEAGDATSQHNLGVMYANGMGVARNDQEAARWYRQAAEQGHASSQFNLGLIYAEGKGVTRDDQEAVKWFSLAAEQGNADAQRTIKLIEQGSNPRTQTSSTPQAQQRSCTSNASEINNQIARLSSAYDARLEDLRSRSLQAGLRGTAAYGLGGFSRGVAESGLDRERDQLTLQRTRDIADLRSRIVEICDPIPAPRDNSAAIERGTSIATTLQELNELFESGALTDEEFQAAKRKALGLD